MAKTGLDFTGLENIEIDILDFGINGEGIGKYGGLAIFVQNAIPGDKVLIRLNKVKNRCGYGEIKEIIHPSPYRIKPECNQFGLCGGCGFLHTDYKCELEFKRKRVNDAIKRIGGVNFSITEIVGMDNPHNYRNKAVYHIAYINGKLTGGFYKHKSNSVIPSKQCGLVPTSFNNIVAAFCEYMEENGVDAYVTKPESGIIKSLTIRQSALSGGILAYATAVSKRVPQKQRLVQKILNSIYGITGETHIKGIGIIFENSSKRDGLHYEIESLWGDKYITESVCRININISIDSFFQVNTKMASQLYKKAVDLLKLNGNEVVADAYCGIGAMALLAANKAKKVIGIELLNSAVDDAYMNAKLNNITNAEFICGDTGSILNEMDNRKAHLDAIILDPPRCGCDKTAIESIIKLNIKQVVYISCDAATLARDLKSLLAGGYTVTDGLCFDMFSRCAHVETVVLLTKEMP